MNYLNQYLRYVVQLTLLQKDKNYPREQYITQENCKLHVGAFPSKDTEKGNSS